MSHDPAAVLKRFLGAYDARDWNGWKALAHDHHVFRIPISPEPLDRDGHLGLMQSFRRSFSQMEHVIESTVVDGDTVAIRGHLRLVHDGEFQGVAPTGKTLTVSFMDFARIEDGRVREEWVEFDAMGMFGQLGLMGGG